MQFASPIPWWLVLAAVAAVAGAAFFSYRRPLVPLTTRQRSTLIALRAVGLGLVLLFLNRPVLLRPPATTGDVVIPVLVDGSRSMRIGDANGGSRLSQAVEILQRELQPGLSAQARVEILSVTETITPATLETLSAEGGKTDLRGAVAAVNDRYRGQWVPGVVLLSDGADTVAASGTPSQGLPVFAIGLGSPDGFADREVTSITAGDPKLDQASVDVNVSAVSHGFGRSPFSIRLLSNGQLVETRRVTPVGDGTPINELFTVSPDPAQATVYTAELQADETDSVVENDRRSLLVSPAGRKRRVLVLAGAPGHEHSFLLRAVTRDPALEVDSIVRKGKNDQNVDTFLVQAGGGRAESLTSGFPATREALYGYDAVIVANIEGDFFTRAQLTLAASFVAERGGGLMVLGGRSFERRGLIGSALEEVLPLELNDRHGGPVVSATAEDASAVHGALALTTEGERHPVMRLGSTAEESRKLWSTLPSLASNAAVGGPRPGASVLAVASGASGVTPVVAVQRYGRGRSMIFAGEATWRWRMLLPSTDRRYELFWRQALRWLSSEAPDPVSATVAANGERGDTIAVEIDVHDSAFKPVASASVAATLTAPGGIAEPLPVRPSSDGRFAAAFVPQADGAYRLRVEASRTGQSLGVADRWIYVGGSNREFFDARLNEGVLRRMARESGGRYVRAAEAARIIPDLQAAVPRNLEPVRQDLWHTPWAFALVTLVLATEWILRRRWGLR